jgi:hypothetical protein
MKLFHLSFLTIFIVMSCQNSQKPISINLDDVYIRITNGTGNQVYVYSHCKQVSLIDSYYMKNGESVDYYLDYGKPIGNDTITLFETLNLFDEIIVLSGPGLDTIFTKANFTDSCFSIIRTPNIKPFHILTIKKLK